MSANDDYDPSKIEGTYSLVRRWYFDRLIDRDGASCFYCERAIWDERRGRRRGEVRGTLDHVQPKSRGGENDMDNYVIACSGCNKAKGNGLVFLIKVIRELRTERDVAKKAIKRLTQERNESEKMSARMLLRFEQEKRRRIEAQAFVEKLRASLVMPLREREAELPAHVARLEAMVVNEARVAEKFRTERDEARAIAKTPGLYIGAKRAAEVDDGGSSSASDDLHSARSPMAASEDG